MYIQYCAVSLIIGKNHCLCVNFIAYIVISTLLYCFPISVHNLFCVCAWEN